jgi:hypothetical protein
MKRMTPALFALAYRWRVPCSRFSRAEAVVTIDCATCACPRMVDVGVVTGIDNVGAAYAEREKLMHQAARLCRNPAVAIVHFVPDSDRDGAAAGRGGGALTAANG